MQTADQSFFEKEYIFEKKPEIEDIPKQIRELLTTQGGRLKRIIILGISAEDIILYGNISINKIRNYLAFIEKCTDVVVVGFAPSDIEVPIKKTAPYFMEDYEGLISEIETMENVVFDAEPDINEVGAFLAICDEYVGGAY